jgi:hypothetical protein
MSWRRARAREAHMRILLLIALGSILAGLAFMGPATAGDVTLRHTVDLDAPGALDGLRQSNPAHFEAVRRILDGVLERPDATVPRWMQVSFGARDVSYVPVLLTSAPPKRRLSFVLDDTRYETVLTLTNARGGIVPLR